MNMNIHFFDKREYEQLHIYQQDLRSRRFEIVLILFTFLHFRSIR